MKTQRHRYLVFSPPFSGHLHPNLGLALHLSIENEVAVVSTPSAEKAIRAAGLRPIIALQTREDEVQAIANPGVRVKNNPYRLYKQLKANLGLMDDLQIETQSILSTEKPDAVIVDFTLPVAGLIAERRSIPWFTTLSAPCAFEGKTGPAAYMGGVYPGSTAFHRLRDYLHRKTVRMFKRLLFVVFRADLKRLGIPSPYYANGNERIYSQLRTFALGMKEIEFDRGCSSNFSLVGPILYTPPVNGISPLFIHGKKHVLITLGTHLQFMKNDVLSLIQASARTLPDVVFHFSYGDAESSLFERKGNVHRYGFISYADHLHRYDAVIHHCGTGIMYECIRHGIPVVSYPVDYDQFDNAVRLKKAGIAVHRVRPDRLTDAIVEALESAAIRAASSRLRQAFSNYNAVHQIQREIEALIASPLTPAEEARKESNRPERV